MLLNGQPVYTSSGALARGGFSPSLAPPAPSGPRPLPAGVAVRPGVNLAPQRPAPAPTPNDFRTGYAPSGNPALDAYNNNLADAIAYERYWADKGDKLGIYDMGLINPGSFGAAYMKNPDTRRDFVIEQQALGTYADPTYGGATTRINDLLNGFGGGYQPQMVSLSDINSALGNVDNAFKPKNVSLDGRDQAQIRGQQMSFLDQLRLAALGQGPSAAQSQLQSATDQNIAQQMALAASARGTSNPAAQLAARNQGALIQQRAANDSVALRNQEMQQAMGLYGGALQGVRGQDQGWAGMQADVGFQNNAQGLQSQQLRDARMQGLLGLQLQGGVANQNAGLAANAQNNSYQLGVLGTQYNYASLGQQGELGRLQALMQQQAFDQAKWESSRSRRGQGWKQFLPLAQAAANTGAGIATGGASFAAQGAAGVMQTAAGSPTYQAYGTGPQYAI